jgi:hypothetical protein
MPRDWSSGALDDLIVDFRLNRAPRPQPLVVSPRLDLRLPLLSVFAGGLATVVYAWPTLLLIDILAGGFRPALFGWILVGCWIVVSLSFWAVTAYERRHWARNIPALGDFADPPTWK